MAAYSGSLLNNPQFGGTVSEQVVIARITVSSNVTNADTFSVALAASGTGKIRVTGFQAVVTGLDTNASPGLTLKFGTAADDDGFLKSTVIPVVSTTRQGTLTGNGALIGTVIDIADITGAAGGTVGTAATGEIVVYLRGIPQG